MPRSLNKALLIGNVGTDIELRNTAHGTPIITFRLATSEMWKDVDGNTHERTDWHTIVAWRGLAKIVSQIITKGARIYVEGKIQARSYQDRNNKRRSIVEILADNIILLDNKRALNGYEVPFPEEYGNNMKEPAINGVTQDIARNGFEFNNNFNQDS